jgi:hypothetical protein
MSRLIKFLYLTQEQVKNLVNAHRVYQEAQRRGIGQELELWHEPVWI